MKINYDAQLYKKAAQLNLNEVIITRNKKGKKKIIHITNITQLSWQDLQLIVRSGQDRFRKIVILYNKYISTDETPSLQYLAQFKGEEVSPPELNEINEYIQIYKNNVFTKHYEVNLFITNNNMWNDFPIMRSLNTHGERKNIKGILPKYFEIICIMLGIAGEKGHPLDEYTHY